MMPTIPSPLLLPPAFEASSKPWQITDKVNWEHNFSATTVSVIWLPYFSFGDMKFLAQFMVWYNSWYMSVSKCFLFSPSLFLFLFDRIFLVLFKSDVLIKIRITWHHNICLVFDWLIKIAVQMTYKENNY